MHKLFVCPVCKSSLTKKTAYFFCKICALHYHISNGIVNFIPNNPLSQSLSHAQKKYESMHKKPWHRIDDGSYEILASIARGNKTLDIACGDGFIESLAPSTFGLDFSHNALLKAKKMGGRFLVQAAAELLPFKENSFDVTICAGSLEHFSNPGLAICEMARVSRMQVFTIHTYPTIPFARFFFNMATVFFKVTHQPIERPLEEKQIEQWLIEARLKVVFKGIWNLPVNYGRVIKFLPELTHLPSCSFFITTKK